jgi:hypothetical protein
VDLANLFHVGDFSFHTAFVSNAQGAAVDQVAQDLLQRMAEVGGGTYRSFPSGEELNFLHIDLSIIRRVFTLRTLAAVNINALMDQAQVPLRYRDDLDATAFVDLDGDEEMSCGEPLIDTDGDGLADVVEVRTGSDPFVKDTDDDGLSDRVEWDFRLSGLDPLDEDDSQCFIPDPCLDEDLDGNCDCILDFDSNGQCNCVDDPDQPCMDGAGHDCLDGDGDGWCDCPDLDGDGRCDYRDRDGDGLHDCEEIYFGTAQNGNDTDADGVPDILEVRYRTSPIEKDNKEDLDWDLTENSVEVLGGTDPICDDAAFRSFSSYRYVSHTQGIFGDTTCYDFDVSNVTLVPTRARSGGEDGWPGNGWNRIYVYAGEVAFDDPETFAVYRVACVEARYQVEGDYKNPPSGKMEVAAEDFIDVTEFDPATHCKRP